MLRISNHYVSKAVFGLLFLEFMILIASFYAGASMRFLGVDILTLPKIEDLFMSSCLFASAIVFSMSALGMYQLDVAEGWRDPFFRQLVPAFAMAFGILALVFYVVPALQFGRGVLAYVFVIAGAGILTTRAIFIKTSQSRLLEVRILFLGAGQLAQECGELTRRGSYRKYHVAGYVATPEDPVCVPQNEVLAASGGSSLVEIAQRERVNEIVVSVQNRRGGQFPIKELLECKLQGIKITDAATFFERETCQIRVGSVQPSWLVFGGGFDQGFARLFMKRAFDLTASLFLLIATLPVMLVTMLLIYAEDRAPVFYSQERVGRDGKLFRVLKFRSMGNDAEKGKGPQWAQRNDPRVTRVGRVIRKLRIDELPQIVNVFKGEMSFVGPRPERPYFVDQLTACVPYYNVRHSIKPGITGWAQVRYGYGDSVDDALQKLQYDMYYVKNNSLLLDVLVLIDTVQVVMGQAGR